jgi:hypothetical protein
VLVDHARQKRAEKRGGGAERVTLELVPGVESYDVDMLDEALSKKIARVGTIVVAEDVLTGPFTIGSTSSPQAQRRRTSARPGVERLWPAGGTHAISRPPGGGLVDLETFGGARAARPSA